MTDTEQDPGAPPGALTEAARAFRATLLERRTARAQPVDARKWDQLPAEDRADLQAAVEAAVNALLAAVTAERDGLRKSMRAIVLGIAEPSPRQVAEEALDGRYFDPEADGGVWNFNGAAAGDPVRTALEDDGILADGGSS